MLFASWDFAVFFSVVYLAYLALPRFRQQNMLLLVASYYFYAAWNWHFLPLLLGSTLLDYVCALKIDASDDPRARKAFLLASVIGNLTLLGFFKYFGFFVDSAETLLRTLGVPVHGLHLDIVLPVGISFYTFQEMSYTIDVYRREIRATRNLLDFACFVAFFPHMVAGPIMRASLLLRQLMAPRRIDATKVTTGAWLVFWGLWKKIVIADNVSAIADSVFGRSAAVPAAVAYLGVVAFAFQIYCDFSAYSDIARGLARLMGIELMRNFDLPYFACNPSDFWRRWHISLSQWLRDYLYIPLGGNRRGPVRTYWNLFVTMVIGGLWHGAAWNYVWWGAYHGALLVGHRLVTERRPARAAAAPWRRVLDIALMFQAVLFGWLLFRCTRVVVVDGRAVDDSWRQIVEMLSSFRNGWGFGAEAAAIAWQLVAFCGPLVAVQLAQFLRDDELVLLRLRQPAFAAVVASLGLSWVLWGVQSGSAFIYFQF